MLMFVKNSREISIHETGYVSPFFGNSNVLQKS